eukprot:g38544.t1
MTDTSLQPFRFTPCDIKKQLETLDAAKAMALIRPPLAKLFQYSYNTGIYLTMWKITQICPVHKRQDKSKPPNYRPISLLSIIGKVMEGIINSAIKQYMLKNNLLSDAQFGFRQGHSASDLI